MDRPIADLEQDAKRCIIHLEACSCVQLNHCRLVEALRDEIMDLRKRILDMENSARWYMYNGGSNE